MHDSILENLRKQLLRYQNMVRKEKEQACGAHAGMCAYLCGAIAATEHAINTIETKAEALHQTKI